MEHAPVLLALAAAFGLFMAWGIGANDVANAMGTSVGSGAINTPFIHLPAYVQAERGGWLSFQFATWGASPVVYRPRLVIILFDKHFRKVIRFKLF